MKNLRLRLFGVSVAAVLLAACGGGGSGGSSSPTATANTPSVVSGTVTGFGSLIIDGVEYDDSVATVRREVDPANPAAATKADVKLGQTVDCTFANGKLDQVTVAATVIGPIDMKSLVPASGSGTISTFKVLSQSVNVVTSGANLTLFEGATGFAALQDGETVEVYGVIDAKGAVNATRIVVVPAGGTTALRVSGTASGATATTFMLGTLTIDFSKATLLPSGAAISNGEFVSVFSNTLPTATTLVASTVRVRSAKAHEGQEIAVGGMVTKFMALSNFQVEGVTVDASKITPTPAIVNGTLVRVEGMVTGGVLVATELEIMPATREVRLIGPISGFVAPASFQVRNTPVDATGATFLPAGKAASNLGNGAFVAIVGTVNASGTAIAATTVTFFAPPMNETFRLSGLVTQAAGGGFTLLGINMVLDPAAGFIGGTAAQIAVGANIEVTGSFNGATFMVTRVRFLGVPVESVNLTGTIAGVTPSTGTVTGFMLGNATVTIDANTRIVNGPLASGQLVQVSGTLTGTTVLAGTIIVKPAGTTAFLQGMVDKATVSADGKTVAFSIDGQAVQTTATTVFQPSTATAASVVGGAFVRVTGTPAAGVVQATAVQVF